MTWIGVGMFVGRIGLILVSAGMSLLPLRAVAFDLETIKPGKLIVAFNGDMPGTSWQNGKLIGLDGELVQWIADQLGLKVEPALMEWSGEVASVTSGRADLMVGMMGWTVPRTQVMLLSDPLYYAGTRINQKKTSDIHTIQGLEGKRIAVMTGTAAVNDYKKISGTELKLFDTLDAAVRALLDGRVDVASVDAAAVQYGIKQNPQWDIKQLSLDDPYNPNFPVITNKWNVVLGLRKEAPNLAKAIDEKIAAAWANCLNRETAAKYGLGETWWFTPPNVNARANVDRPADWKQPELAPSCR